MFCLQRTHYLVERTKNIYICIYIKLYHKPYLRNMNGHNNFLSNDNTSIDIETSKQSEMESEAK